MYIYIYIDSLLYNHSKTNISSTDSNRYNPSLISSGCSYFWLSLFWSSIESILSSLSQPCTHQNKKELGPLAYVTASLTSKLVSWFLSLCMFFLVIKIINHLYCWWWLQVALLTGAHVLLSDGLLKLWTKEKQVRIYTYKNWHFIRLVLVKKLSLVN